MSSPEERNPSPPAGGFAVSGRSSEIPSLQTRREPFGVARGPEPAGEGSKPRGDSQDWLNRTLAAGREEQPRPAPADPVRKRPGLRRVKRVIRHVDPLSVLRLSFFFSACFLLVWLLFVAIVYWFLDMQGLFESTEELMEAFALDWNENITLFFVEKWAFLIGLTLAVVGSLLSVLVVFLYNLAADLFGGIELTHVERDL